MKINGIDDSIPENNVEALRKKVDPKRASLFANMVLKAQKDIEEKEDEKDKEEENKKIKPVKKASSIEQEMNTFQRLLDK